MSDLILGQDWLHPVHHLPGYPFGSLHPEYSTLVGVLSHQAKIRPAASFLTGPFGDAVETLSYERTHIEVQRRAALLDAWGTRRGERIGILGRNSVDFVLGVLAAWEAGAVAVLLDHRDPPTRIATRVEFTNARFLLYDPTCSSSVEACRSLERLCSFEQFSLLSAFQQGETKILPKATDGALIFFTSGTTGEPKAVVQSHYSVAQNAFSLARRHRIASDQRLLCVLPLHHVNGLEFTILSVLLAGGHTFIQRGFDALKFWRQVEESRISIVSLVPNLLRLLAERPQLRGSLGKHLRYAVSAAAPLSTSIAQSVWDKLALPIVQGYGLSEVTNFSCLMPPDLPPLEYERWMLRGLRTSVGPVLQGQEVQIRTSDGIACPGVEGGIFIRGHSVMSGYLHNAEATQDAFAGGWFDTGDVGYFLEDDQQRPFIHISGRTREIAKRAGAMVSLLEVDEILASIPGVSDAAAASFSNTWVDEEIGAVIVPASGSTLKEDLILEHCNRSLPFAAIPKAIAFVDEVPRTVTGKIRRAEIADRFAEFRETLFPERLRNQHM